MKTNSPLLTEYDFSLPPELLASRPAEPRDSSRLFVYDSSTDGVSIDSFSNLAEYLPNAALLVFNDTKVVPARLDLKKESGGRVECLFLMNELKPSDQAVKALADRKVTIGQRLFAGGQSFTVTDQREKIFLLKPNFNIEELPVLLNKHGRTPIPKYLGKSGMTEGELRTRYQSVWASSPASVAAPTASLHFTKEVLEKAQSRGSREARITLHVGLGTFAPVTEENIRNKRLHKELFFIGKKEKAKICETKRGGACVVAVGTTTARALESAADQILVEESDNIGGETEIFIAPPYRFRVADALVTNFHLPKSSLMCMVDAFLRQKTASRGILSLYERAIKEKMRFYSFGDAMLIK